MTKAETVDTEATPHLEPRWSKEFPSEMGFYLARVDEADEHPLMLHVIGKYWSRMGQLNESPLTDYFEGSTPDFFGPITLEYIAAHDALRSERDALLELVRFPVQHGIGWTLDDWNNWRTNHAAAALKGEQ